MKQYRKRDFPTEKIRRYLEPGPIVLVSSAWKGRHNIMTMGWHTVMEFEPSLIGCMITSANHSYEMIRKSGECVINVPEAHLANVVARVGNCSGAEVDKFEIFGLTAIKATRVRAPLVGECYAHFECRVEDTRLLNRYNFFVLRVVKATVAVSPQYPKTLHYTGDGVFMVAGKHISCRRYFTPENLQP